jgi:hypothetical protein
VVLCGRRNLDNSSLFGIHVSFVSSPRQRSGRQVDQARALLSMGHAGEQPNPFSYHSGGATPDWATPDRQSLDLCREAASPTVASSSRSSMDMEYFGGGSARSFSLPVGSYASSGAGDFRQLRSLANYDPEGAAAA